MIMLRRSMNPCGRRKGSVLVEHAFVLPLFLLFIWGLLEFGRLSLAANSIISAAQEGCRAGITPGSTSEEVKAEVNTILNNSYISGATVTTTPTEVATLKTGETLTVSVQIPFSQVSWIPTPQFLKGRVLKTSCSMLREGQ